MRCTTGKFLSVLIRSQTMKYLVANYEIELETPIIVKRPDKDNPRYEFEVNGFNVSLELTTTRPEAGKKKSDRNWTIPYTHFVLTVARPDPPPPEVFLNNEGKRDRIKENEYFSDRTPIYGKIAAHVINSAIRYFKYQLWQPMLSEIDEKHHSIVNPDWTDERGTNVGNAITRIVVEYTPGTGHGPQPFGTIKFEKKHDASLLKALTIPTHPMLKDEILYDAQSAIYSNNYRRAVLEMALSTEILVKQALFGADNPGTLAFEYLEDNRKIHVRVIDLIDSLQASGSSFKETNSEDFKNIEYLFRCRNKVAHRGRTVYMCKKGKKDKLCTVNRKILSEWWESYKKLDEWLKKYSKAP